MLKRLLHKFFDIGARDTLKSLVHQSVTQKLNERLKPIKSHSTEQHTPKRVYLHGGSTIEEALHSSDVAHQIFQAFQLQSCQTCSVRFDESLAEAAEAYDISLERWLIKLNAGLSKCRSFKKHLRNKS